LSTARSFRTGVKREMIRFGTEEARITGDILSRSREMTVEMRLLQNSRPIAALSGVKCKTLSELSGVLQTVLFCPADLMLILDGAAARRRFFDTALCQLRPAYGAALAAYQKAQASKTKILKALYDRPDYRELVPVYSAAMAKAGAILIRRRAEFCRILAEETRRAHLDISGGREELALHYDTVSVLDDPLQPAEVLEERLFRRMEELRDREEGAGMCLTGPHRDDLNVLLNGRPARSYGSQGQVRTAALSLKLAEREIFKKDAGEAPVLLLDDVLSELDEERQDFVLNRIGDGQVFITCCEEDKPGRALLGKVFSI